MKLGSTMSGLVSAILKPGFEETLREAKLQFITKSENRSLDKNTFKSSTLAKILGCFGAGKWGYFRAAEPWSPVTKLRSPALPFAEVSWASQFPNWASHFGS